MPSSSFLEAEQASVKSNRWAVYSAEDFSSLPSVALSFLNQLAGYALHLILRVDEMVELSVDSRLRRFNCLRGNCGDLFKADVRILKFLLLR
jgi:hypothetical protein